MSQTTAGAPQAQRPERPGQRLGAPSGQKERVAWIDMAKGISMLAVVLGHQGQSQVSSLVFPFHLMIFFLLSGYTLKVRPVTGSYVAAKFGRLMKPYFLSCLAVLGLDVLDLLVQTRDVTAVTQQVAGDLMRSFAASGDLRTLGVLELPSRIGAIWFFPAMFLALMGAQLILNYVPKYRYPIGVGLIFLAQMSVSLGWLPFSIQPAMMAVFFVVLGYDIKTHRLLDRVRPVHYLVAAVIFALGVWGKVTIFFVCAYMTDPVLSTVVGLSGCLLVYGLSRRLPRLRPLTYTGQYSSFFLSVHLVEMETLRGHYRTLADRILAHLPGQLFQVDHVYGVTRFALRVGVELLLIYAVTLCLVALTNRVKDCRLAPQALGTGGRMVSVDMAKGILILLMITGHYPIDQGFSHIIYSFHMLAFVVLSGLFYKPCTPWQRLKKDVHTLILPYVIFSVGDVIMNTVVQGTSLLTNLRDAVLCMSFSRKLFPDAASVGPVYFILMLLVVRVVYSALQTYFPRHLTIAVVLGTLGGIWLGQAGLWLPWSLDVALYLLVPYHLGRVIRERGVLAWVKDHPQCYFLLVLPWAYSVSCGGIEIATREYGTYADGILGAVCATLLVYLLCEYVAHSAIPQAAQQVLRGAGRHSIWVLISHVLLEALILAPCLTRVTTKQSVCYLAAALVFDVAMGCLLGWGYDRLTARRPAPGGVRVAR